MSATTGLPPAPPSTPTQPPAARDGSPARILDASGSLAQLSRPATVTGQVIALSPDGSVKVHTDQGDITLQPRGAAATQLLTSGQTVEIDLSAGRPPRQAVVREADSQTGTPTTSTTSARPGALPPATGTQSPAASAPGTGNTGEQEDGTDRQALAQGAATSRLPPPLLTETLATGLTEEATAILATNLATPAAAAPVTVRPDDPVRLLPLVPGTRLQIEADTAPLLAQLTPTTGAASVKLAPSAPARTAPPAGGALTFRPASFVTGKTPAPAPLVTTPLAAVGVKRLATTAAVDAPPVLRAAASLTAPLGTTAIASTPITTSKTVPAIAKPTSLPGQPRLLDIRLTAIKAAPVRFSVQPGRPAVATVPSAPTVTPVRLSGMPALLTGTIVGQTRPTGGLPSLPVLSVTMPGETAPKLFVLQTPATNLPVGTQISFAPPPDAANADTSADDAQSLPLPAAQWPALASLHDAVAALLPHDGASPLAALLPNPAQPVQLLPAALLFVAALRAGDLAGWLGGHVEDSLRRAGLGEAIDRLTAEGAALAPLDAPPQAPDGWRLLAMPLLYQGEVQRAILRYRRGDADEREKDDRKRRQTRFLFDMALDRMGPVQLDGLHQPKAQPAQDDRLDLIVRTCEKVSASMQAAMRTRYHAVLESCGHQGEMSFQFRLEQWQRFEPPEIAWTT